MRIIKRAALQAAWTKHRAATKELQIWFEIASRATWRNIIDVRCVFPNADPVPLRSGRTVTAFFIKGNRYRLIVSIHYNTGLIYIREFLTHAEYSKDDWKKRS